MRNFIMQKYFLLSAVFMIMPFFSVRSVPNPDEETIAINTMVNVDLGDLPSGSEKSVFWSDQVVVYEIICKKNEKIRITKNFDDRNSKIKFETEWKAGPRTGFEDEFANGIHTPVNNRFYVTVKIKSVRIDRSCPGGNYDFNPGITVEYVDA